MSAILAIAGLLVSAAPVPPLEPAVDAAYDEVSAARDAEAIARIEAQGPTAHAHPAQLINLGVAYARQGDADRARKLFRRAANAGEVDSLETADGTWASSRVLALDALASLKRGRVSLTRTARR